MKGSEFVFNYVHLLYYKCHKINPNRGVWYIDSSDWIKNKKVTRNSFNKYNKKCVPYAITVVPSHEKNRKTSWRIKLFKNKYKW